MKPCIKCGSTSGIRRWSPPELAGYFLVLCGECYGKQEFYRHRLNACVPLDTIHAEWAERLTAGKGAS